MAQASPQLQQFIHQLGDLVPPLLHDRFKQLTHTLEQAKSWLLSLIVLLLMLLWNWQLVISVGGGVVVLVLVYLGQQGQFAFLQIDWRKLWSRSNRPLVLAVTSGTIACFSLYLSIAIWQETGGSWLAKGLILQGLSVLAILLILLWQRLEKYAEEGMVARPEQSFNHQLAELTDVDPLKRLIAIRQLTAQVQHAAPTTPLALPSSDLADCFRLMLNRETEPIVCRALVDSLKQIAGDLALPEHPTRGMQRLGQGEADRPISPQ